MLYVVYVLPAKCSSQQGWVSRLSCTSRGTETSAHTSVPLLDFVKCGRRRSLHFNRMERHKTTTPIEMTVIPMIGTNTGTSEECSSLDKLVLFAELAETCKNNETLIFFNLCYRMTCLSVYRSALYIHGQGHGSSTYQLLQSLTCTTAARIFRKIYLRMTSGAHKHYGHGHSV